MEEIMSDDVEKLKSNLNAASSNLRRVVGGKAGDGVEKTYGQAYQALVRVGVKPQLKKKYR